ncbi:amino acid adenylation domain-containing protein, partial [Cytobacillus purgationiresistens]
DILRTVFTTEGDQPLQLVLKQLPLEVKEVSLLAVDKKDQQEAINAWKTTDKEAGFNLEKGPLMRLMMLQTGQEAFVLIWSHHHILMDGWCLGILLQEFLTVYAARREGRKVDLGPIQSYGRYMEWLKEQDTDQAKEYWEEQLKGYSEKASLPKKQNVPSSPYKQEEIQSSLTAAQTKRLEEVARELDSTVSTVLQTVWGILLSRYNQQEDVVFGTVVSGRPPAVKGVESIVGLFINTLPVRIQFGSDTTFAELVKQRQEEVVASQEYGFLSLAEIQAESELGQELIDHLFVVENYPFDEEMMAEKGTQAGLHIQNEGIFEQTSYDFNVVIVPGELLKYTIRYNPNVYAVDLVGRLEKHFAQLIDKLTKIPNINVSEIQIITTREASIIQNFNKTKVNYNLDQTIIEMFENQVKQNPQNMAVAFRNETWSYKNLNKQVNQLARHLQAKGVGPEKIVGIMVEPSADMFLAVLAVLKAGGAYIPIDPSYPDERIHYMMTDSQARLVITQKHLSERFKGTTHQVILEERGWTGELSENLSLTYDPKQLAYVIYTSGTTGYPKGVMVEHHSLSNLCHWHNEQFKVTEEDRCTKLAGFGFDASVWEIFPPLLKGASLYIVPEELRTDLYELNEFFEQHQITISFLPTPLCEPFLAMDNQSLRVLLTGGDKLKSYRPVRFQLVNNYGPTENTVVATSGMIEKDAVNLSIGRPIANTKVYIFGKKGELQPIGVPGELCISGEGLARGYLNQPALTAEKFIDHPLAPGTRLYRSGDLARWLPDGRLEYLGRIDDQVKIRGHRIELGEIETQLLHLEGVEDALVLTRKDSDGFEFLCAFLKNNGKIVDSEIRTYLSKRLPNYMIPIYFIRLEKFPLTKNGKVDRQALGNFNLEIESTRKAPSNPIEKRLVKIWKEVLNSDAIGIDDHFFYKGGHSLKAANLAARVSKEFKLDFPIRIIFEIPILADMASYINTKNKNEQNSIVPVEKNLYYPASSAQERIYIISQFDKSNLSYNIPSAYRVKEKLSEDKLYEALFVLVKRHESLRTSFKLNGDVLVQKVSEEAVVDLSISDVIEANVKKEISDFVKPFDLTDSPLMRVKLMHTEKGDYILLLDMHHIISDGMSMEVLIKDFMKIYQNESLFPLTIQYKDYAIWQRSEMKTERLLKQEKYWMERLTGEMPTLELPVDFKRPAMNNFIGNRYQLSVNEELTRTIKKFALNTNTSLYMVLLSAYSVLLSRYSNQDDIIIGSVISGRIQEEVQDLIGMFANTLALRVSPKSNLTFRDFLLQTKEVVLDAFDNQEYPFEKIVETLNIKRDASRNAIFDTVFLLRESEKEEQENNIFSPISITNQTSKFDITLETIDDGRNLMLDFEYSTQLFKYDTIQKMAKHFLIILEYIMGNPDNLLSTMNILSKEEEKQILIDFNSTEMSFPTDKRIDQLVEEQAMRSPFETALVCGERRVSYQGLSRQANSVATHLILHGIRPGDHVGILTGRKAETVAGLLGILK